MDQLSDFQSVTVFAELGVALAGFGLLGSILSSRRGSDHPALDATRLRTLVNGSAVLALAGLLPMVAGQFHLPSIVVWRTASVVFFVGLFAITLIGGKASRELKKRGARVSSKVTVTLLTLETVSMILLLVNVVGIHGKFAQGFYLGSLTVHTACGFVLFAKTFSSIFTPVVKDGDKVEDDTDS